MKSSCWEATKHDVFVSGVTRRTSTKRLNCRPPCSGSQSTSEPATTAVNADLLLRAFGTSVNRRPPCSVEPVSQSTADLLPSSQSASEPATMAVNSRPSPCPSAPIGLYNNHLLEALGHRLIKRGIEATHTHTLNLTTNQHPKHQTKKFGFRSAPPVPASLPATMAPSESATTASDPASMASYERARTSASVSPLQRHQKRMRLILYTSRSQYTNGRWTYYTTAAIREQWHEELENKSQYGPITQSIQPAFSTDLCLPACPPPMRRTPNICSQSGRAD